VWGPRSKSAFPWRSKRSNEIGAAAMSRRMRSVKLLEISAADAAAASKQLPETYA
jgi:hypothetical protein